MKISIAQIEGLASYEGIYLLVLVSKLPISIGGLSQSFFSSCARLFLDPVSSYKLPPPFEAYSPMETRITIEMLVDCRGLHIQLFCHAIDTKRRYTLSV